MDPFTIAAIVALGAVAVMVFWLIDNAIKVFNELEESSKRIDNLEKEVRNKEEELKRIKAENELRKLEDIYTRIDAKRVKIIKERNILGAIVDIISNFSITKIPKLVSRIYESFFLKQNLANPDNVLKEIKISIDQFEREIRNDI